MFITDACEMTEVSVTYMVILAGPGSKLNFGYELSEPPPPPPTHTHVNP